MTHRQHATKDRLLLARPLIAEFSDATGGLGDAQVDDGDFSRGCDILQPPGLALWISSLGCKTTGFVPDSDKVPVDGTRWTAAYDVDALWVLAE